MSDAAGDTACAIGGGDGSGREPLPRMVPGAIPAVAGRARPAPAAGSSWPPPRAFQLPGPLLSACGGGERRSPGCARRCSSPDAGQAAKSKLRELVGRGGRSRSPRLTWVLLRTGRGEWQQHRVLPRRPDGAERASGQHPGLEDGGSGSTPGGCCPCGSRRPGPAGTMLSGFPKIKCKERKIQGRSTAWGLSCAGYSGWPVRKVSVPR